MRDPVILGALLLSGSAWARPIEAVRADRASTAMELQDLDRRAESLDEQIELRKHALKRRVRALYKLTQGGGLRLLVEAKSTDDVGQRLDAAQRVVSRDLHELGALAEELDELSRDRTLRTQEAAESATLADPPTGKLPRTSLERRRGDLARPVAGAIVSGLSRVKVSGASPGAPSLELPRRTVELASSPGEAVHSVAAGTVRWVGLIDGMSHAVVIDHGEHYVTVTGRLRSVRVVPGAQVAEGQILGHAESSSVSFELSESRTALDPASWLRAPMHRETPASEGPAHASVTFEHPSPL